MYGILSVIIIVFILISIMFLPVFIAKKRQLTPDRIRIVKICTWLSILFGFPWLVALILSLFLDKREDIDSLNSTTIIQEKKSSFEKQEMVSTPTSFIRKFIAAFLCFGGLLFMFILMLVWNSKQFDDSKFQTLGAYCTFCFYTFCCWNAYFLTKNREFRDIRKGEWICVGIMILGTIIAIYPLIRMI